MTQAKKATLQRYKAQIKWGKHKKMGFSQGMAIKTVIEKYKIPAIAAGAIGTIIGVETKKQYLFWRDKGGELEFKGILNK